MNKMDFQVLVKNDVIKFAPMVKVAEALEDLSKHEKIQNVKFDFDEMENFVESWLIADLDSNFDNPAWKHFCREMSTEK